MNKLLVCLASFGLMLAAGLTAHAGDTPPETCGSMSSSLPEDVMVLAQRDGSLSVQSLGDWSFFSERDGKWDVTKVIQITCTCTSGSGGCNPGYFGGNVGCVMTSCTSCSADGLKFVPFDTKHTGVTVASEQEQANLKPFDSRLFDVPRVVEELDRFMADHGALKADPANTEVRYIPINVYGYLAAVAVPSASKAGTSALAKVKISCECQIGDECKHDSKFGVHWCDATECSRCKLTAED